MTDIDILDGPGHRRAARPVVRGQRGIVSAGHPLAAAAGYEVLRKGGTAIDAGVAAGLAINVVHHDMTSFGGVAPIIMRSADADRIFSISGVGRWPQAARIGYFREQHDGVLPRGILRSVVPGAPDAWIKALVLGGRMSFQEVSRAAVRYARDGYPVYEYQYENLQEEREAYEAFPSTADVFLKDGDFPRVGDIFVQEDLARTLERMVAAETDADDRLAGLQAARDCFYEGPIAEEMAEFSKEMGGLLRADDLADFSVGVEEPVKIEYGDYDVFTCGPWSQGPVLAQTLKMLEQFDLLEMGHNAVDYLHTVLEALKLAYADREWYYGDPEFTTVPMDELVSVRYARNRADAVDARRASPELPPPGTTAVGQPATFDLDHLVADPAAPTSPFHDGGSEQDTSYVAAIDGEGNVFSATPSSSSFMPLVTGLGFAISGRGSQSRLEPQHPNRLEPWKRPRITPNPALVMHRGEPFMAIGTPGADVQPQAMLQVFLNLVEFGMNPQQAVEAPRVATYSFPASFAPHRYYPGVSAAERGLPAGTFEQLDQRGHEMKRWRRLEAGVGVVMRDPATSVIHAGADPRKETYAVGE